MSLAKNTDLTAESFADFVQRLRHDVRGEGVRDHCTADAIFVVQEKRYCYGIDRAYTEDVAVLLEDCSWRSPSEYWKDASDECRAELDKMADGMHNKAFLSLDVEDQWDLLADLDDHTVTGYAERWEYVNSHFTKDAAEAFIARKKHDYRDGLRVYVDAQSYCWEFNAIIEGLLSGKIAYVETKGGAA